MKNYLTSAYKNVIKTYVVNSNVKSLSIRERPFNIGSHVFFRLTFSGAKLYGNKEIDLQDAKTKTNKLIMQFTILK